jgi:death-on-curing protein
LQNKYIWLSFDEIVDLNLDVVTRSGEQHALIDKARLEGALERPYSAWCYAQEDDVVSLSVTYMVSIAEAHAFIQGNKRTGFIAGQTFMNNHGYDIDVPDTEETAALFEKVINHEVGKEAFQTHLELFITDYVEQE